MLLLFVIHNGLNWNWYRAVAACICFFNDCRGSGNSQTISFEEQSEDSYTLGA